MKITLNAQVSFRTSDQPSPWYPCSNLFADWEPSPRGLQKDMLSALESGMFGALCSLIVFSITGTMEQSSGLKRMSPSPAF